MDWYSFVDPDMWTKIALSVLCGLIIGVERQVHNKPIDIRMSVLICLGTMAFIYLGEMIDGDKDSTRVLGQIATGIGFLGAGAIFTRQGLVIGLTSASVVWVLASIGSAIGFGFYEFAIVLAVVTLIVLYALHWVEDRAEVLKKPGTPKVP